MDMSEIIRVEEAFKHGMAAFGVPEPMSDLSLVTTFLQDSCKVIQQDISKHFHPALKGTSRD